MPLNKIYNAKRIVVKVVRANLLLNWFANNLNVLPPALVIRHPCAIIASQMNKGWPPAKKLLLNNSYLDNYPEIKVQCEQLSHPEEFRALAWCLRYHAPLSAKRPHRFLLVCYEKLVRDGERELKKLFKAWDLPVHDETIRRLTIPSDTVEKNSQIISGKDPLAGWKNKLSEQQINNILAVLAIFKMDFYSNNLEPDYERLNTFSYR